MSSGIYSTSISDYSNEVNVALSISGNGGWTSTFSSNNYNNKSSSTTTTHEDNLVSPHKIENGLLMHWALSKAVFPQNAPPEEEIQESDCLTRELMDAIDESMDVELYMHSIDYRQLMPQRFSASPLVGQNTIVSKPQSQLQRQYQMQAIYPGQLPSQRYYHPHYSPINIPLQSQTQPQLQTHLLQPPYMADIRMYQQPHIIQQPQIIPIALPPFPDCTNDSYISFDSQPARFESDFRDTCERIWRMNDQKASLTIQERIRAAIPSEYEVLVEIIHEQVETLMVHRFGNFVVQCMLETANIEDIERFASGISGKVAAYAKHQFCCHVLQKLLDVSPLLVQARIASELLDDVYDTMTSTFGSHVWQKMLHLPWSEGLPSLAVLANNAIRLQLPERGWLSITATEAGCSTIRSYLCLGEKERLDCTQDLLAGVHQIMTSSSHTSALVCKLAMLSSTRSRTMALIFSRASEYCQHPYGSEILINLLRLKIPSFPTRFNAAVTPYSTQLEKNKYSRPVLLALEQAQVGFSLQRHA